MNYLSEVVETYNDYFCIYRQGFVFTSITEPAKVLDAIVIRNPENCDCWSPKKSFSQHSLDEHIELINRYKLEKAIIIAENIGFIKRCPSLKYIQIIPADTAPIAFDYSPLYEMPEIRYLFCKTAYGGSKEPFLTKIDYSRINGLKELRISGKGHQNYSKVESLEQLFIMNDKTFSGFENMNYSENMKSIWLFKNKLKSLKGIAKFKNLQRLVIDSDRILEDISEIKGLAESLRSLDIENCPKITDFSCLHDLYKLEHLSLYGQNELPNLDFLGKLPKLKTFTFSVKVESGDLTPCLGIPYVYSAKNRKEYNLKDRELPKGKLARGFEII